MLLLRFGDYVYERAGVNVKRSVKIYIFRRLESIMTLLTAEEKELLEKATSLMDELLETLEVMQDSELVKDLRAALREIEKGKTIPLDELIRELGLEGKV